MGRGQFDVFVSLYSNIVNDSNTVNQRIDAGFPMLLGNRVPGVHLQQKIGPHETARLKIDIRFQRLLFVQAKTVSVLS